MSGLDARRGRPRKFSAPSRAVTLTLPQHVIEALGGVDEDLSRAIVRLAPVAASTRARPAELTQFGRHAVIVVSPSRTFARRTGVELVPLPDGRALISFPPSLSIPELELLVEDATDDRSLPPPERKLFEAVAEILRDARRSSGVALLQRSIIVLESRRSARRRRKR